MLGQSPLLLSSYLFMIFPTPFTKKLDESINHHYLALIGLSSWPLASSPPLATLELWFLAYAFT